MVETITFVGIYVYFRWESTEFGEIAMDFAKPSTVSVHTEGQSKSLRMDPEGQAPRIHRFTSHTYRGWCYDHPTQWLKAKTSVLSGFISLRVLINYGGMNTY